MPGMHHKAKEIFAECLKTEPQYRPIFLQQACGDDSQLRQFVERLLEAHERDDSFLEAAAIDAVGSIPADTQMHEDKAESIGSMIGSYKLLQLLGEGGMGSVYMAEQAEPVRRKVALKIIKPGMDSSRVIARFEAERQALALMDHHNIARVLDAGTTDSDRPYFVMELVKGVPITEYCDSNRLTPRERLELFIPVCRALQHAHQKGIIHRDIKPNNVLVTQYDGHPVPKVIDFGIAKATGKQLTERTMFTEIGQIIGTPEYMSPEQAELNQLDIDTRSDVYSLGVLLYELLTGSTPITREELRKVGMEEMLRTIRESEPPRPSERLSSSGEALPSISAVRKTEPQQLSRIVRGDLDWIVMKALEKERVRRFETASEFALDLERYLNDEPVLARRPSTSYRFHKFVQKHRVPVSVAALFFTTVLFGLLLSLKLYFRANTERQLAELAQFELTQKGIELESVNQNLTAEQQQTRRALEKIKTVQQQTEDALERERRAAYFASISLAYNEWQINNVPRADSLLDECPEDLRHWEWNYLKRISNSEFQTISGFKDAARDAVFSPDGKSLVTIDLDGKVKTWDVDSGNELLTFRHHTQIPSCASFSHDGRYIVSGSARPIIGGRRGHGFQDILRMMFVQGRGGGEAILWEAETGKVIRTFGKEHEGVTTASFSADSVTILTSGNDNKLRLWNTESGELIWEQECEQLSGRAAVKPDGGFFVISQLVPNEETDKKGDKESTSEGITIKVDANIKSKISVRSMEDGAEVFCTD